MRLRPSNCAYLRSRAVTTRRLCALWSKPPKSCIAVSSARSPACPNGGWPRSWASAMRLGEILVEAQLPRHGARDLRHLQRVRQPRAVVIALVEDEHLRLVGQAAEGGRVQHAVAVALERAARRALGLGAEAATRSARRRPNRRRATARRAPGRRRSRRPHSRWLLVPRPVPASAAPSAALNSAPFALILHKDRFRPAASPPGPGPVRGHP